MSDMCVSIRPIVNQKPKRRSTSPTLPLPFGIPFSLLSITLYLPLSILSSQGTSPRVEQSHLLPPSTPFPSDNPTPPPPRESLPLLPSSCGFRPEISVHRHSSSLSSSEMDYRCDWHGLPGLPWYGAFREIQPPYDLRGICAPGPRLPLPQVPAPFFGPPGLAHAFRPALVEFPPPLPFQSVRKDLLAAASLVGTSSRKPKLISGPALRRAMKHKCPGDTDAAGETTKKAKLETKSLKEKRPGFNDDRYNETSYYIENGLRKVYPYHFTFTTFTKGRWVGQKILDVFAKEFRSHPADEYERAIRGGSLTVNCKKVDVDYCLKHNELLSNTVHRSDYESVMRHEVPVTAEVITIVHADKDLVVVNKPASIPVHPCGRYRHNTVVFILAKEYGLRGLRTIHRLDRLTSGLLLFGRSPQRTKLMEQQIRNRQVQKEYICRVEGEFPSSQVECHEPIHVVSYKIGVSKVSAVGKQCHTTFQRLSCNGSTSVVLARPHQGRMHQIRVHLQYLGYPIVNDPLYNSTVFGPNKGRGGDFGGKSDEELIRDLISIHNAENWLGVLDGDVDINVPERPSQPSPPRELAQEGKKVMTLMDIVDQASQDIVKEASTLSDGHENLSSGGGYEKCAKVTENGRTTVGTQTPGKDEDGENGDEDVDWTPKPAKPLDPFNPSLMTRDDNCHECKVNYRDPKPKDLFMYLHAWKYEGPGWSFKTELPKWTLADWVADS